MLGFWLFIMLSIYLLLTLISDIIEEISITQSKTPSILRILYFIPKLIPFILIVSFLIYIILNIQK